MKKFISFTIIIIAVTLFASCDKVPKEIPLNLVYTGDGASWEVDTTSQTSFSSTKSIYFNADSLAAANNYNIDNFKTCKIKALKVQIIDGSITDYTFDLINSINAYVGTGGTRKLVVSNISIPKNGASELELSVTDENIRDLVLGKRYEMSIEATTSGPIQHKFTLHAQLVTYNVEAVVIKVP